MLRVLSRCQRDEPVAGVIVLSFEDRQKSRQSVCTTSGERLGLLLPHGTTLRNGDRLRSTDGRSYRVESAPEALSVACSPAPLLLARAAYHLGNRHIPLQIEAGRIAYRRDPVLDHLIEDLGLTVQHLVSPFEPEGGAYEHRHRPHDGLVPEGAPARVR